MGTRESTATDVVRVYHVTNNVAAAEIDRAGFRDATDHYLTANQYTGVWVSDSQLDENEGTKGADTCFLVELPAAAIADFEWVEEGKSYREWLVPAEILNRYPRTRMEG